MEERITSEGEKGKTRKGSGNRERREYRIQDEWNDAQDQQTDWPLSSTMPVCRSMSL